ncbi:MAG: GNAT family N-acetyltransferase [Bacteroidetes bacterium]|nr:MAG: GNAT family N-acetyltransferase [Bacteroidota bacterium]REK04905.1 MAG: GNAT family N-acetyltransferase [Bacteroidota bacterium]REK36377.1 MAG: GNAT family N-acetyltransferase [Bacteroidota bacterium]REK50957.1 MAG: GNAT family N-acetyltransferase [Bacteroidota bacterium]
MAKLETDIQISKFSDSDYARLIRLTESTYPGKEISHPLYLKWEYEQNPDGRAIIYVAEEEKKLAAQYLILQRKFYFDGEIISGSWSVNTLTHPDYRGMGLFGKLADKTYQHASELGIYFTAGVPNALSYPVFISRLGFKNPGKLNFFVKPLRPLNIGMKIFGGLKSKEGSDIHFNLLPEKSSGNILSEFDFKQDSDAYEGLHDKFIRTKKICGLRNFAYLKWRYQEIPERKYYLLKNSAEELKFLLVCRAKLVYGLNCLIILDIIADPEMPKKNLIEYMKDAIELSSRNKIDLVVCALSGNGCEAKLLKDSGFILPPERFLPQQLHFIYRQHNDFSRAQLMDEMQNWHLTFGDYDVF